MQVDTIKQLIEQAMPDAIVDMEGDGSHFFATIISNQFADKNKVQRQRLVYAALGEYITDGSIHALSMKTFTPQEWEQTNG